MTKIKMFEKMYELEEEMFNNKWRYGENHKYTANAKFEWYGAREILEAAGLYGEYIKYAIKRKEEANK